jgi:hypothetical protein
MRLPWPFARSRDSASPAAAGPDPEQRPAGGAWRGLPPIDEMIGPPPLVAPVRPFAQAMAAGNPPPPILAPLSHGRSLEAPRGIVVGIARPTAAAAGPAMPRPVQRSPLGTTRNATGLVEAEVALEPSAAPVEPEPRRVPTAPTAPTAPQTPMRSFTQTADPGMARPMPGLVGQPRPSGSVRAKTPDVPEPAIQRAPLAPPDVPPLTPGPAGVPDAPRLTLGQTRRRGLGAPIGGGPIGASTPLMTLVAASPAASPAESPAPDLVAGPAAALATAAAATNLADLPLATRSAPAGSSGSASDAPAPAPAAIPVATPSWVTRPEPVARPAAPSRPAGSPSARRDAPLVSRPSPQARVQRAPMTVSVGSAANGSHRGAVSGDQAPGESRGSADGQVRVHRGPAVTSDAAALDARSFTRGGEIFLPASHGPLDSGTGRALLAHELTHVAQQSRLGSSLPLEHTPHGQSLEAEAVAAERSSGLPLASPTRASTERGTTVPGSTYRAQRAPDPATTDGDGVTTVTLPGATQRAPIQRAAQSSGPQQGARRGHSEQELEELAGQLYARIGRRLRREILVDRERSGLALDLP